MKEPLLRVRDLTKHFPVTRGVFGKVVGQVQAVDGVSFDVAAGETLGLVGESGCGKSTVGRLLVRLLDPTAGEILVEGKDIAKLSGRGLRAFRRDVQIIFQDPYSSLNPRMRVVDIVGEALQVHGVVRGDALLARVASLLERVGVAPAWMNRFPHEFSGGQRQRIGIARALALDPKLIVCDEAVSALDVSIQAQVLNLLADLREDLGISFLFISHDLSVVRHISDRVAVMYLGQLVEVAPVAALYEGPLHPYADALLAAVPEADPLKARREVILEGEVPTPLHPPPGCRFHTRCPVAMSHCASLEPKLLPLPSGRMVSCHHATEVLAEHPELEEAALVSAIRARVSPPVAVGVAAEPELSRLEQRWSAASQRDGQRALVPAELGAATGPSLQRWGLGGVLAGIVAVLFGHFGWALLLLTTGVAASAPVRRQWRRLAAVVLLAALLSLPLKRVQLERRAREDVAFLTKELAARHRITGEYPRRLSELGWRLYPRFPRGLALDPWGRTYRYRIDGAFGAPWVEVGGDPALPSSGRD